MLKWIDVLKFANNGNPPADQRVEKTEAAWEAILTPEQFRVTRQHGTERAYSSEMCQLFEPGKYACVCCDTLLFDGEEKFDSGTGWPSFTQPLLPNTIAYHKDRGQGMYRIETVCNTCDAHLGHVFQDGPPPSGLRYCMNAVALKKVATKERRATFGGGCFWCTEALFQQLRGVMDVKSGYSGGAFANPTYREVASGLTGHAEVIEVTYLPEEITFEELLVIHLTTHNPTILRGQRADKGTQYRSLIFYRTPAEQQMAIAAIAEVQKSLDEMIVTEVVPFAQFYPAEAYHQNYYAADPEKAYCQNVIEPKLQQLRALYGPRPNH
ncbi:MAG: protein-methionine-S-oxide reductase [Bacteroidetes bacterium]|nr:MAG: protein-methionine-S-oxide reductase [Bacteroidota bacterium]PTM13828.1 MAG: protein-methionine-S-oxide reductase [Bacteroidota bacterium]